MTYDDIVKDQIKCEDCVHNDICYVKDRIEETEITTTSPYIKVSIECTQFIEAKLVRRIEDETT